MSGGLRVDGVALRAVAPSFAGMSADLSSALRTLAAALAAEGACWGGDEAGAAFAEQYGPAAQQAQSAMAGVAAAVSSAGDAIVMAADNAAASDVRSVTRHGGGA